METEATQRPLQIKLLRWALLLSLVGLVYYIGCEPAPDLVSTLCLDEKECRPADPGSNVYTIEQEVSKLDILFVVDTSVSMNPELEKLGNAFSVFIERLTTSGFDYHVGIVTMDMQTDGHSGNLQPFRGPGLSICGNASPFCQHNSATLKILKSSDASALRMQHGELFKATLTGIKTDCEDTNPPEEQGLCALAAAMEVQSAGFFRRGAHLAVVMISDEDECSDGDCAGTSTSCSFGGTPNARIARVKENHKNLIDAHKTATQTFSVYAVVINDNACSTKQSRQPNDCTTGAPGVNFSQGVVGSSYVALAQQTEGKVLDLCANSYQGLYDQVLLRLGAKRTEFKLACEPLKDERGRWRVQVQITNDANQEPRFEISGNLLTVTDTLPADSSLRITYHCSK